MLKENLDVQEKMAVKILASFQQYQRDKIQPKV